MANAIFMIVIRFNFWPHLLYLKNIVGDTRPHNGCYLGLDETSLRFMH